MISSIKKSLRDKKENVIFDIYIKDYDKSNFYFALVFNEIIEKYKVLFVPLDAINKNEDVSEYFCYQFIFINTVNHFIEKLKQNIHIYKEESNRNRKVLNLDSYYIEININLSGNIYTLNFTQFIDEEYLFLFDPIVVIFEHSPHIVNELCHKLLSAFQSKNESFHYTVSLDSNLADIEKLFSKEIKKSKKYSIKDVKFLEQTANRYYGIVNNNLIIIDFNNKKNIVNIYSDKLNPLSNEVYIMIRAIKEGYFHDFYHLRIVDSKEAFFKYTCGNFYLCYGINEDEFQIIDASNSVIVPLSLLKKECIKISGADKELKKELEDYLTASYEDYKVEELINFALND